MFLIDFVFWFGTWSGTGSGTNSFSDKDHMYWFMEPLLPEQWWWWWGGWRWAVRPHIWIPVGLFPWHSNLERMAARWRWKEGQRRLINNPFRIGEAPPQIRIHFTSGFIPHFKNSFTHGTLKTALHCGHGEEDFHLFQALSSYRRAIPGAPDSLRPPALRRCFWKVLTRCCRHFL